MVRGNAQALPTLFPLGQTCQALPPGSCDEIHSSEEGWAGVGRECCVNTALEYNLRFF